MLNLKLPLSLSLCVIFISAGFIRDKLLEGTEMHIDRLYNECRGKQNVPCHGYFHGFKHLSAEILFVRNYTLVVKEGGFKNLMLTIVFERCLSKENLDTCEEHFKQPDIDFCQAIDPNYANMTNIQFMFPMVPLFKCPIKKGIYHAYNFTYNIAPFIFFDVRGWYWKVKAEVVAPEQNRAIYCLNVEVHATNSKLKRN